MSAPRYDWWGYAKGMIRRYPRLAAEYRDLRDTPMTAQLTGMPHTGRVARPVEDAALRTMPRIHQRELEAVHGAVQATRRLPHGDQRLQVIRLVYWQGSHTLAGAALEVKVAEVTAKRWNGEFIRQVGQNFGLLDGV